MSETDMRPAAPPTPERRELLAAVRTVVVKVGTNVLTRPGGEMALSTIHAIVEDLADLYRDGYRPILVSSGAIGMGMHRLGRVGLPGGQSLEDRQAFAAVGQIRLMSVYQQALGSSGLPVGQILLTAEDFGSRTRYLNLRNVFRRLLELGVVPVVNENDSVSTREIEDAGPRGAEREPVFGDNDVLSAQVASKLGADLLLLLSDVDGLYSQGPPGPEDDSRPLGVVPEVTPEVEAMAGAGNARGRGGMATKLRAVRIAVQSGTPAVIANGRRPGEVRAVLTGEERGTLFLPRRRPGSRKRWIAFATSVNGRIVVNRGAYDALRHRQKSLLFAGVTAIEGDFHRGDIVAIALEDGEEFARGVSNYDARAARPLVGQRSTDITRTLGHKAEELVHRDDLAITE